MLQPLEVAEEYGVFRGLRKLRVGTVRGIGKRLKWTPKGTRRALGLAGMVGAAGIGVGTARLKRRQLEKAASFNLRKPLVIHYATPIGGLAKVGGWLKRTGLALGGKTGKATALIGHHLPTASVPRRALGLAAAAGATGGYLWGKRKRRV